MPFDRDDTLKKAEKLLRQGRLEQAIVEYARVVEDQPSDWGTTNTLGDLYVRAGQAAKAADQFGRIADHFMNEGFYPRAAALYKKLLKLNPQDERALLNLAEVSQKQGLLADAKAHLHTVAARRRSRGDRAGTAEIVVRLGSVDPADFDARSAAARTLEEMGDEDGAAARFRGMHDDLVDKGRHAEALDALREAARLNPYDQEARILLAKAAIASGDLDAARAYLDAETAGDDPELLRALLDVQLRTGQIDEARATLPKLLSPGVDARHNVLDLAWATAETNPGAAYTIVETVVDAVTDVKEYEDAATILREFLARVPRHVPALLKLIEVCVDGGLEAGMCEAQADLADAYLQGGQATEARHVAEDLVAREPWERGHIDRFRRALVMLKVSDPDSVIAERLSGHSPFMVTDPFADGLTAGVPIEQPTGAETAESGAPLAPAAQTSGTEAGADRAAGPAERPASPESGDPSAMPELAGSPAGGFHKTVGDRRDEVRSEVERQTEVDQSAHYMTLARTYLEMGMPDDAIGSLEVASRAPQFRFEAASLLGRLHAERREHVQAIEWLERAAEAPAPTVDQGRALLYDLGTLVETSGETAKALAIFLELQAEAGEYRDVAERVERLARAEAGG